MIIFLLMRVQLNRKTDLSKVTHMDNQKRGIWTQFFWVFVKHLATISLRVYAFYSHYLQFKKFFLFACSFLSSLEKNILEKNLIPPQSVKTRELSMLLYKMFTLKGRKYKIREKKDNIKGNYFWFKECMCSSLNCK